DVLVGKELDFLESYDLRPYEHVAMCASSRTTNRLFFSNFEHADLRIANRVREVVHLDRLHIGFALFEIQMLDMVLLALVDVDRFRMDCGERRREIDLADHVRLTSVFASRIDDDEVV